MNGCDAGRKVIFDLNIPPYREPQIKNLSPAVLRIHRLVTEDQERQKQDKLFDSNLLLRMTSLGGEGLAMSPFSGAQINNTNEEIIHEIPDLTDWGTNDG